MAARAGVSRSTVSNVLNNPDVVRPALRERVLVAIDELGFVPDRRAREFSLGRNRVIGLMFIDIHEPLFVNVLDGLSAVAADHDYLITIAPPSGDVTDQQRFLETFESYRYAAVVLSPGRSISHLAEHIRRLQQRGTAVLRLGHEPDYPGISAARLDEAALGHTAARHLLEAGHRDLAIISSSAIRRSNERSEAFHATLAQAPGVRVVEVTTDDLTPAAGAAALTSVRTMQPATTAVFCVHDLLAYGCLDAARQAGLAVPDDLSVLGAEDLPASRLMNPELSSITAMGAEIGRAAASMLIDQLESDASGSTQDLLLQGDLVVRGSTSQPHPGRPRAGSGAT
ncbi:LacI family DNA-binding transcriptional regulator [Jiangella endophytica]|uniref:LacI family DNA-binding transcriptional regulator n=1 Tax=Jiangella endophytica TaxID=1623398 RepID=UPI0018E58F4C|nr:LacI family DNA-binding transcriptional regulator [Jiangella endophytica]